MKLFMRGILVLLAYVLLVCPVLAAERNFIPVAGDAQEVEYDDGEPLLLAMTEKAFVVATYIPRDKKSGLIKLELKNISEASFTLNESDITAASGTEPLVVFTYSDRLKAQKREEMWTNIALAMAAGADGYNAANAGYTNTTGRFDLKQGGSSVKGSYSERTYDSTAAYQAQSLAAMRSQQRIELEEVNANFARKALKDRALKTNTLSSSEVVVGDVQLALPKKNKKYLPSSH